MNRRISVIATDTVGVERFDHAPGLVHRDPERERATTHAVSFLEAGSFRVRAARGWHDVTADRLLVTSHGLEVSYAHEQDHPTDRCLSIRYSSQAVDSLRHFGVERADPPVRLLTNRLAYLRRALGACGPGDEARAEGLAGEVLWSLAGDGGRRQALFRPARLAWYAARVDRVKAMMQARYAEPLSLSALAREAGMSVFHFARVFSELEGRPPHRFLSELRLAHARARLDGGAAVTETCFAVGFGSLSHFVTTFRRRYGVRPSDLRRGPPLRR